MRLTKTKYGLRVTEVSWLWAAIGIPIAAASLWAIYLALDRGDFSVKTAIIGIAGFVALAATGLLTSWTEVRFETENQRVVWKRLSAFRSAAGIIGFEDVRYATVQYMTTGTSRSSGAYRVVLTTEEGVAPLTETYSMGRAADDRWRLVRTAVNATLGVRLESEDAQDVAAVVRDGNLAWATRFAADRWNQNSTDADRYVRALRENEVDR